MVTDRRPSADFHCPGTATSLLDQSAQRSQAMQLAPSLRSQTDDGSVRSARLNDLGAVLSDSSLPAAPNAEAVSLRADGGAGTAEDLASRLGAARAISGASVDLQRLPEVEPETQVLEYAVCSPNFLEKLQYARQDLNLHLRFRKPPLYPLSYGARSFQAHA